LIIAETAPFITDVSVSVYCFVAMSVERLGALRVVKELLLNDKDAVGADRSLRVCDYA
jgi:hypothetical protein